MGPIPIEALFLSTKQILKFSDVVVRLVFKKKAFKGLISSPLHRRSVTKFRVILCNKMFLGDKMMIYIIFCDKKFSRDLQLRKMLK